jgi:hypothetical protein
MTNQKVETIYGVGRVKRICGECKQEFWCYPGQHEWALPTTHARTADKYIKAMTRDTEIDPAHKLLFCSYHCMRAEEKRRAEVLKKKYDKLMWEAENCYDENGNPLKKKKYQKHKESA